MSERIRLRSAAALVVSLTMVGVGIHGLAQDGGDGGKGTTVDLASSVGSHTPTAASADADADADGETRSPAFVEAPVAAVDPGAPAGAPGPAGPAASADPVVDPDAGHEPPPGLARPPARVRDRAPIAAPTVTHKSPDTQRPPSVTPTRTGCLGYVHNSPQSQGTIGAEMWTSETPERLDPGAHAMGTSSAAPVGGFDIGHDSINDDFHITVDYFEISGGYLETHDLDVTEPRRFDVYPCHEAYVTATVIPDADGTG